VKTAEPVGQRVRGQQQTPHDRADGDRLSQAGENDRENPHPAAE